MTSATLTTAPPLRGAQIPAKGAAVQQLVIPGRPQARTRNGDGRRLHAATTYLANVRHAAAHLTQPNGDPQHPTGHLRLDITLTYTADEDLPVRLWPANSIPNADTAASLVLQGLTGALYTHASQANPLIVTRRVIKPVEAIDRYGATANRGCTIITWEA